MKQLANPFLVYGYEGPEYFCDRETETKQLISSLNNGWNITLVSPRRMGKTGLIKNTFYHILQDNKNAVCVYADIFGTNGMPDFVNVLGTALLNAMMSKGEKALHKIMQFFASWRPVVSMDPMSGEPSLSITLDPQDATLNLQQIFNTIKDSDRDIFIAIDEFQQINEYEDHRLEAQLRSYIQFLHNAHFIFSGSKQHLMAGMFLSPKRPFYQSTRMIEIGAIGEKSYYSFAAKFFKARHLSFDDAVFHYLYDNLEGHTWYMQSVLNQLYAESKDVTTTEQIDQAFHQLVMSNDGYYETILTLLPEKQQTLLAAIASEGEVSTPTSGQFVSRYGLTSASSVSSALKALTDKELIYHAPSEYHVYDRFFAMWLKAKFRR